MSGWKDWQIGEVVTEGEFQSFIQDQVVQVYANASARDSALGGNVATGMVAYLTETDEYQVYNSVGEWVAVGAGTISSVIAGTALTGGGTEGDVTLNVDLSAITIPTSQISDITATAAALNTIDDGTSGFTALSNGTAGISYQPVSHNYIINGAFDVWQRGTSFPDSNGYTTDRWRVQRSAGDTGAIATRVTDTPENFDYATKVQREDGDTSTGRITLNYRDEEFTSIVAGKNVSVSFFAKKGADFSANLGLIAEYSTTSAAWGSFQVNSDGRMNGLAADFNNNQSTFSLTETWEKYTFTFAVDSTAKSAILAFRFELPTGTAGADDSFFITGVQLEAGSVATPFKRHAPDVGLEKEACKRYYRHNYPPGFFPGDDLTNAGPSQTPATLLSATMVNGGVVASNRSRSYQYAFSTEMRANPTSKFYDFAGNLSKYTAMDLNGGIISNNHSVDTFGGLNVNAQHAVFQTGAASSTHHYCGVMHEEIAEL